MIYLNTQYREARIAVTHKRKSETPRQTYERLYGKPADIDAVWEDRDALHEAEQGVKL